MSIFTAGNTGAGYPFVPNPYDGFSDPFEAQEAELAESRIQALKQELEEAKKSSNNDTEDQSLGIFSDAGPTAAGAYREKVSFTA